MGSSLKNVAGDNDSYNLKNSKSEKIIEVFKCCIQHYDKQLRDIELERELQKKTVEAIEKDIGSMQSQLHQLTITLDAKKNDLDTARVCLESINEKKEKVKQEKADIGEFIYNVASKDENPDWLILRLESKGIHITYQEEHTDNMVKDTFNTSIKDNILKGGDRNE